MAVLAGVECGPEGATGLVTNGAVDTANVTIEVEFLDSSGSVVHEAVALRPALHVGESDVWLVGLEDVEGAGSVADCRAAVSSLILCHRCEWIREDTSG